MAIKTFYEFRTKWDTLTIKEDEDHIQPSMPLFIVISSYGRERRSIRLPLDQIPKLIEALTHLLPDQK